MSILYKLLDSSFLLTLGIILLICGSIMLYSHRRLNLLERSLIEHGKILQNFIINYNIQMQSINSLYINKNKQEGQHIKKINLGEKISVCEDECSEYVGGADVNNELVQHEDDDKVNVSSEDEDDDDDDDDDDDADDDDDDDADADDDDDDDDDDDLTRNHFREDCALFCVKANRNTTRTPSGYHRDRREIVGTSSGHHRDTMGAPGDRDTTGIHRETT